MQERHGATVADAAKRARTFAVRAQEGTSAQQRGGASTSIADAAERASDAAAVPRAQTAPPANYARVRGGSIIADSAGRAIDAAAVLRAQMGNLTQRNPKPSDMG